MSINDELDFEYWDSKLKQLLKERELRIQEEKEKVLEAKILKKGWPSLKKFRQAQREWKFNIVTIQPK